MMGTRYRRWFLCVLFLTVGAARLDADDAHLVAKSVERPTMPNLRLILPPVIHAVVGVESSVYFDNVCLAVNPRNYAFDGGSREEQGAGQYGVQANVAGCEGPGGKEQ